MRLPLRTPDPFCAIFGVLKFQNEMSCCPGHFSGHFNLETNILQFQEIIFILSFLFVSDNHSSVFSLFFRIPIIEILDHLDQFLQFS